MRIFACFLVSALPKVWDQIQKQFSDKVLYIYCSKFFLERFVPKNGVQKDGFLIVFSKSNLGGGDIFSEKAKPTGTCPSFGGNVS